MFEDRGLSIGSGEDGDVGAGKPRQLPKHDVGADAMKWGHIHRASHIHVAEDGHVYNRVVGEGLQHRESNGEVVHHEGVATHLHGPSGVFEDLRDRVGDVHRVERVFPGLLIHLPLRLHVQLCPGLNLVEGGVRQKLVVFDDVATPQGCCPEQFDANFWRIAGTGLDHVVEQGTFGHPQAFSDTLDAEFWPLEPLRILLREADVHHLYPPRHRDIADDGGEEHGNLLSDVDLRVGDLDDVVSGLQGFGDAELQIGYLIHPDDLGHMAPAHLRRLAGHGDPRARALFDGQRRRQFWDGDLGRERGEVGDDEILIVIHPIWQGQR